MENDLIAAEIVEISEFPHLTQKYQVRGVPKTIINEDFALEGAAPESMFIDKIIEASKKN
jgi:predicted DsbA family dithiol-disulfide isomerase